MKTVANGSSLTTRIHGKKNRTLMDDIWTAKGVNIGIIDPYSSDNLPCLFKIVSVVSAVIHLCPHFYSVAKNTFV